MRSALNRGGAVAPATAHSGQALLVPLLSHLRTEPSRCWSVIITLYGDAAVPRGGGLWLGTVLAVFEALGIGGNVVRTAMSRLTADAWLDRARVGRNSYYHLAAKGHAAALEADARIYAAAGPEWDGAFHLAITDDPAPNPFAALAPGVFLAAVPVGAGPWIGLRATAGPDDAQRLVQRVWPGERLAEGYGRFIAAFGPVADALAAGVTLTDLEALTARVLLVHQYRRLVLRDPSVPDALRAPEWPGQAARNLCAGLYQALLPGSERWLDRHARCRTGELPAADATLARRFERHITKNLA